MKRYAVIALALVLGCMIFTGCRRMNGTQETTMPQATRPTDSATMPTVPRPTQAPTMEPTVMPTEEMTGGVTDGTDEAASDPTGTTGGARRGMAR